jgi:hypothetical protein
MLEQANEESTQKEWKARLTDIQMERDLRAIEAAVRRYRGRTGALPPSLEALVAAGDLPAIPREPHGGQYRIAPNGTVWSTAGSRLRITGRRGTIAGLEVK